MAVVQITDARVSIEPDITTVEYQFGPSDTVASNAVLLTRENLRKLGAYPVRESHSWDCHLWVYWVIAGVETLNDISTWNIAGSYWDPVSRSPVALTVAHGVAIGQTTISFAPDGGHKPGTYQFAVDATVGVDTFGLYNGWLEIAHGTPTP